MSHPRDSTGDGFGERVAHRECRVPSLMSVIEPGKHVDMETLPRPRETMPSHPCDLQMLAIGRPLVAGESER
jgi:hypothetical protein